MKRPKMSRKDRAKIFMPFDALKGFRESLNDALKVIVPKKELSEDDEKHINEVLNMLTVRMLVSISYYKESEKNYFTITGIVTNIDYFNRYITVVKDDISFDDIIEIEIIANKDL